MSEKTLTELVKNALRNTGWRSAHFHDSRRQVKPGVFIGDSAAKGFPDIVAVRRTRLLVAELKSDKGKFRDGQEGWLDAFTCVGAEVFVWRPEHWNSDAIWDVINAANRLPQSRLAKKDYGLWTPREPC
jgi:hypothetical protein